MARLPIYLGAASLLVLLQYQPATGEVGQDIITEISGEVKVDGCVTINGDKSQCQSLCAARPECTLTADHQNKTCSYCVSVKKLSYYPKTKYSLHTTEIAKDDRDEPIPGGMKVGKLLRILYRLGQSFKDNDFILRKNAQNDALYMSIDTEQKQIRLLSRLCNTRTPFRYMSFSSLGLDLEKGQVIEVIVVPDDEEYHLYINGKYITYVQYVFPPADVERVIFYSWEDKSGIMLSIQH